MHKKLGSILPLLLALGVLLLAAARPAPVGVPSNRTIDFKQTDDTSPPVYLPERVFFDPNNGENNKVEDYIANVYIGEVDLAEADPVLAAAGTAAGAGIQFQYSTATYFDYEAPTSKANIGPGAKAVGAAVARVLGGGSAKAAGRGSAKGNVVYSRDAWNGNSVKIGTESQVNAGLSGGVYIDRTSGNDNDALLQQPEISNFAFGHH